MVKDVKSSRVRVLGLACAASAVVVVVLGTASVGEAQTPPRPPADGQPGHEGPCEMEAREATNYKYATQKVYVRLPSGDGELPGGARCSDPDRPIVVIAHGLCLQGLFPPSNGYTADAYADLVRNFVSNGSIVIFPTYCATIADATTPSLKGGTGYDQIASGFATAIIDSTLGVTGFLGDGRGNLDNIGFFGHSYGGGIVPWLAELAWASGMGEQALWIATFAPFWNLSSSVPFVLPAHTRSLHVIYQNDAICTLPSLIGIPCNPGLANLDIYNRIPAAGAQKWALRINSDCAGLASCPPYGNELRYADHFTPGNLDIPSVVDPTGSRGPGHLKFFGSDRNLQLLQRCATNPGSAGCDIASASAASTQCAAEAQDPAQGDETSPACSLDLTYMGKWTSPTFHATHATNCAVSPGC